MAYSISAAEANFINETARYDIDVMHPAVSVVDLFTCLLQHPLLQGTVFRTLGHWRVAQPIDMVHDCTVKKIC